MAFEFLVAGIYDKTVVGRPNEHYMEIGQAFTKIIRGETEIPVNLAVSTASAYGKLLNRFGGNTTCGITLEGIGACAIDDILVCEE